MRSIDKLYSQETVGNSTIVKEIQELKCSASSGHFTLSFRGYSSGLIYSNSTISEIKTIFGNIPTLGDVALDLSVSSVYPESDSVCSPTQYNQLNITFNQQYGLIPLLHVNTMNLTGGFSIVSVSRVVTSSGPSLLECTGRGECDRGTGECNCWTHYGSSDGYGERGVNADCGYNTVE